MWLLQEIVIAEFEAFRESGSDFYISLMNLL